MAKALCKEKSENGVGNVRNGMKWLITCLSCSLADHKHRQILPLLCESVLPTCTKKQTAVWFRLPGHHQGQRVEKSCHRDLVIYISLFQPATVVSKKHYHKMTTSEPRISLQHVVVSYLSMICHW